MIPTARNSIRPPTATSGSPLEAMINANWLPWPRKPVASSGKSASRPGRSAHRGRAKKKTT